MARLPDGKLLFTAPDGRPLSVVPFRDASEDMLADIHEWAKDCGLDLGADTMPLWGGARLDDDWAVTALVAT